MTRESKLYPSAIQAQCQSAIAILQADNEKLLATRASVSAFVEDKEIVSISFDQLRQQCSNYIDIIDSIINMNSLDIEDYGILSESVGTEKLDGDIIITNQERFAKLRNSANENERTRGSGKKLKDNLDDREGYLRYEISQMKK